MSRSMNTTAVPATATKAATGAEHPDLQHSTGLPELSLPETNHHMPSRFPCAPATIRRGTVAKKITTEAKLPGQNSGVPCRATPAG